MLRPIQFIVGLTLLIAVEILKVYFARSTSGSQQADSDEFANFLHDNIFYFRTIGWLIILVPAINFFVAGSARTKALTALGLVIYGVIFYFFNYRPYG